MPAVTLKHSTTQSSQNCGVRIALRAETFAGDVDASAAGPSAARRGVATHDDRLSAHDRCARPASAVGIHRKR